MDDDENLVDAGLDLPMTDIMEALGETLKIDRPSMKDIVGKFAVYAKVGNTEHGEYVFRFDNGRGAVLLIDGPQEERNFVILETYWNDQGSMCVVVRPDSSLPYVLHTSNHQDDVPAMLAYLVGRDPHPYVGPAEYETEGGERLVLSNVVYTSTQGRIDFCTQHKLPYINVRMTEWFTE
ncbi:MAG: hypothetical protein ACRC5T_04295 [Cetobacterium sp.]